jgi:hypothetical protein
MKAQRDKEEAAMEVIRKKAAEQAALLLAQIKDEEKATKEREAQELAEEKELEKKAYE